VATGTGGPLLAVTYLPAVEAARYRPGSTVTVTADNLATGNDRTLVATVSSVASSPSDVGAMAVALQSDSLARRLLDEAGGAAYRVQLAVRTGGDRASAPDDGQVVTITNTYAEPRPVDLLLGRSS
jgi:hypothetical protein